MNTEIPISKASVRRAIKDLLDSSQSASNFLFNLKQRRDVEAHSRQTAETLQVNLDKARHKLPKWMFANPKK